MSRDGSCDCAVAARDVAGGQAGFWSSKPFLTNVFSSLTAALFGVPLALVVLQRLGMTQAEAVNARAARRLAATVVEDLAAAAPMLHPAPVSDLRAAEAGLLKVERAAQEAITGSGTALRTTRAWVRCARC